MEKYVRLQEKVDELVEENLKLESSVNLMSIDMAESGYASQGTWQKLQEQQQQQEHQYNYSNNSNYKKSP